MPSKATPRRAAPPGHRLLRIAALAALAGFTASALAATARADAKSEALFRAARQRLARLKTLRADYVVTMRTENEARPTQFIVPLELMRPDAFRLRLIGPHREAWELVYNRGRALLLRPAEKEYLRETGDPGPRPSPAAFGPLLQLLLQPERLPSADRATWRGWTRIDGQRVQQVFVPAADPRALRPPRWYRGPVGRTYSFDARGALVGVDLIAGDDPAEAGQAPQPVWIRYWLRNVRENVPIPATRFALAPPPGFRESPAERSNPQEALEKTLLPVGQPAPSFRLPRPGGGELSLEEALKDKKLLLLNFWFHG